MTKEKRQYSGANCLQNGAGRDQLDVYIQKIKKSLDTDFPHIIKSKSEWITDLSICVKCKTTKLLQGNIQGNLDDI